jgi:hypothetical protein
VKRRVCILGLAALFSVAPLSAQLSLQPGLTGASGTGATPAAEVVLWAAAKDVEDHTIRVRRVLEVVPADSTGAFTTGSVGSSSRLALWVAVDRKTGAMAVAAPPVAEPWEVSAYQPVAASAATASQAAEGVQADGRSVVIHRKSLDLLWVRPDVGVWGLAAGDGGLGDLDPVMDGSLRVELARLEPLTSQDPATPEVLQAGDRVFALDLDTLEHYVFPLPSGWQPSGAP